MKRHLQCAEQEPSPSNLTKYCACHAKWISWLIALTYETSFPMRRAARVTLQLHQILRLPRKMNLMIDRAHIWNVISNAQSSKSHPPTSPNTAPATQNESHDWSASHMKRHLQCAEQQASTSNLTKYCTCHAKWISWLIRIAYETSFTMCRARAITVQPHQILRLPRKVNVMIDRAHIWNVISNAQSSKSHPPTSPDTAPATQNESHDWSASHMKRHLHCAEQEPSPSNLTKYCACHAKWMSWLIALTYETSFPMRRAARVTLQLHQILRLPRKMNLMIDPHHIWNVIYNARSNRHHPPTSPNTAPATQNECHDWSCSHMKRHFQCAEQQESPSNFTKYCACHAKWISWLIRIAYETSFTMCRARAITVQPHQTLRLPRKMNLMIDPRHIWNVIYNARSNRHHPPTSPNTAPATQNECHDWSCSHMKRHFQCAQQQESPSNFTKYCPCHAKWISWLIRITYERHLQCAEQQASPSNLTKYCACHAKWISWLIRIAYETSFTMRGATGITLQPHQILRLPRKMNVMIDRAHIWNVISNAQSSKSHPPTSPDTSLATQNESHDWSASHMKRHSQCAEQQASPSNLTKYCACHAKWMSWLIVLTYETSFPMGTAARVTLQLHQILRLPRKMNVMIDPAHVWNVIYNARSNRYQPATSPNTAPATQNCSPKS